MRRELHSVGAAKGMALGRARIREPHRLDIEESRIEEHEIEAECARLVVALANARAELAGLREKVHSAIAHEVGEFVDLHTMLLEDPELLAGLDSLVRTGRYAAPYALRLQRDRLVSVFDEIDDPYLRSRREDIDHVIGRVYAALHRDPLPQVIGLAGDILVTDMVAPSEMAQLAEGGAVAIVTAQGSPLSHSAILARSLHLPLLVGAHEALAHINDGDVLIVDGSTGLLIVHPDADDLTRFSAAQEESTRERRALTRLRTAPTRTKDGVDIGLYANAESPADVAQAHALGAAGVGLYRTEFLFLQRRELPDEEEQFAVYRDLVLGMDGRPVTLRTLDLGADKADSSGLALSGEENPALGLRGVRLSLSRPDVFRIQLRAILRASAYGPVRILIPMVATVNELLECRDLLTETKAGLREFGVAFDSEIPLGAMIEVPAAAIALHTLLPFSEFFSIGTNDLVQYLLAADRGNDALGALCSPLHPAVVHVLAEVIARCHRARKPVAVCGELASDPRYTRLLLAIGLTEFSMHPSSLLEVRREIRDSDLSLLRRKTRALLRAGDSATLVELLGQL